MISGKDVDVVLAIVSSHFFREVREFFENGRRAEKD